MGFKNVRFRFTADKTEVTAHGIDFGPHIEVHEVPDFVLNLDVERFVAVRNVRGDEPIIAVFKVPGHGYWAGRGLPQGRASTEFMVVAVNRVFPAEGVFSGDVIAQFPMRRKESKS